MHAARQLAELVHCRLELVDRRGEYLLQLGIVSRHAPLGRAELERERDQPLLSAVVDVPFDPAPLGVGWRPRSARVTP